MVTQTILNVFGMADFLPAHGRDVPVRVERRVEHGLRLGPAGLYQGSRYPGQNASVAIRVPHGVTPLPEEPDAQEAAEEPAAEDPDAVWQRPAGKEACR